MQYVYKVMPAKSVECPVVIESNGAFYYIVGDTCYEAWCYVCFSGCCQMVMKPSVYYFAMFYPDNPDVLGMSVDPFNLCTDGCEYYTDDFGCQCTLAFKRQSYREPNLTLVTYVNVIDVFD